eukprot:4596579-Prymnesium_polylepis.1
MRALPSSVISAAERLSPLASRMIDTLLAALAPCGHVRSRAVAWGQMGSRGVRWGHMIDALLGSLRCAACGAARRWLRGAPTR